MANTFSFDYSEKDRAALHEKAMHPDKTVCCPRCGNELTYRSVGNSYEVKCKTDGCIRGTLRGI